MLGAVRRWLAVSGAPAKGARRTAPRGAGAAACAVDPAYRQGVDVCLVSSLPPPAGNASCATQSERFCFPRSGRPQPGQAPVFSLPITALHQIAVLACPAWPSPWLESGTRFSRAQKVTFPGISDNYQGAVTICFPRGENGIIYDNNLRRTKGCLE